MVFLHHQTIMEKFNLAPSTLFGRVVFRHILISGSSATRFLCSLRCVVLFHSSPSNIRYHNQVHHAGPEGWNLARSPLIRLIPDKPPDQAACQNPLSVPRRASYRGCWYLFEFVTTVHFASGHNHPRSQLEIDVKQFLARFPQFFERRSRERHIWIIRNILFSSKSILWVCHRLYSPLPLNGSVTWPALSLHFFVLQP